MSSTVNWICKLRFNVISFESYNEHYRRNPRPSSERAIMMTRKEINIQRALGTLPLWRRIQLGEVEFNTMVWPIKHMKTRQTIILMTCKELPGQRYYYPDEPGARDRTIERIRIDCRKANI